MLKLRRLRVEKFRSLARNAELRFSDGINVLLGQNGTGKTTLLELISMVVRSDFSSLAKEEFAIEYELAASQGEPITVAVRNERIAEEQSQALVERGMVQGFRSRAEVHSARDGRRLLHYTPDNGVTLEGKKPRGPAADLSVFDSGFLAFFIINDVDIGDWFINELAEAGSAYRLDESLDLFRRFADEGDLKGGVITAGYRWSRSLRERPLIPDEVVNKLEEQYELKKPDYTFGDIDLKFMKTLNAMMGFDSSDLRIDLAERRQSRMLEFDKLIFRFWWKDGTFVTHERLSYGQKRLLSFFYYLACNPAMVIADELVNGLHHGWITASIEAIGARQAFLTSQNPLLLDYVPVTSPEEVQQSFVLCRGESRDGKPGWIWDNMGEDDASTLFSAYEVGIEHVSEILQSRGLW